MKFPGKWFEPQKYVLQKSYIRNSFVLYYEKIQENIITRTPINRHLVS